MRSPNTPCLVPYECPWVDFATGYDIPIEVEQVKDQYPANDEYQAVSHDFVAVEEQVEEGKEKVSENQAHAYPKPT